MGLLNFIGDALFGGTKKAGSTESTGTSTQNPWAAAIPNLQGLLGQIESLYGGGAPQISGMEQQGYDALTSATQPSDYFKTASDTLTKTASGDYLDPSNNRYLADIAKRIGGEAGSTVQRFFAGKGRSGSGLAGYYTGKGVGDAVTNLYGTAYENERQRQQQAAGMAPTFDASRVNNAQSLIEAGKGITSRPYDLMAQKAGLLGSLGSLGGTTTSTGNVQQYRQSKGALDQIGDFFINSLFPRAGANSGGMSLGG